MRLHGWIPPLNSPDTTWAEFVISQMVLSAPSPPVHSQCHSTPPRASSQHLCSPHSAPIPLSQLLVPQCSSFMHLKISSHSALHSNISAACPTVLVICVSAAHLKVLLFLSFHSAHHSHASESYPTAFSIPASQNLISQCSKSCASARIPQCFYSCLRCCTLHTYVSAAFPTVLSIVMLHLLTHSAPVPGSAIWPLFLPSSVVDTSSMKSSQAQSHHLKP